MKTKQHIEKVFESMLWRSRLIVLSAVISSMLASVSMFFMATVDAYYMMSHLGEYLSPLLEASERSALRTSTVTHVVEIIDGYLLATVLLIFSLGLYELFISKIDQAEGEEVSSKVLVIHSLDDLKARLSKVVLMILIVKYFEHAIKMEFSSPVELLYLAGGISLIGLALYLTHAADGSHSKSEH
ncbi:MAG: YqhA family protein [Gammaproteobacteria bacterium]|nr:YqhA family protein [Gammaproteobacteria bacterium]